MLSVLIRRISRVGVSAIGLALIVWGVASMWIGWDQIMIERGWSLFIGGAALVAGGAVTFSSGFVLARLDALTRVVDNWPKQQMAQQAPPPTKPSSPRSPTTEEDAPQRSSQGDALAFLTQRPTPSSQQRADQSAPIVIDRYESGDAAYTMFSDGSVEVRTAKGAQRYGSVSELRARMEH
jgi:hypothetical protein